MNFADFFCKKRSFKKLITVVFILISICTLGFNYTKISFEDVYADTSLNIPDEVVVDGNIVGIKIDMEGIMVLGITGVDTENGIVQPVKGVLKEGDYLLSAGGIRLGEKEDLIEAVDKSKGQAIDFEIKRNGKIIRSSAAPVMGIDGIYRLGIWVRDSTQGLGTLTFYEPESGKFGALGHGITDVDTGKLMSVQEGILCRADITAIVKGKKGDPGELIGELKFDERLGNVTDNNKMGVFGEGLDGLKGDKIYKIGGRSSVKIGQAYIISGISGHPEKYTAEIDGINRMAGDSSKCMTIRITDKRLLEKTGGIIQGMSGSPIIQNDKIIGAVTHVFLNDPQRGYGIFIENML